MRTAAHYATRSIAAAVLFLSPIASVRAAPDSVEEYQNEDILDETGTIILTIMKQPDGHQGMEAATVVSDDYLVTLYQKLTLKDMYAPISESYQGGGILMTHYLLLRQSKTVDGKQHASKFRDYGVALHRVPAGFVSFAVGGGPKQGVGYGKTLEKAISMALKQVANNALTRVETATRIHTTSTTVHDFLTGKKATHRKREVDRKISTRSAIAIHGYRVIVKQPPRDAAMKVVKKTGNWTSEFTVPAGYHYVEVEVEAGVILPKSEIDGPVPDSADGTRQGEPSMKKSDSAPPETATVVARRPAMKDSEQPECNFNAIARPAIEKFLGPGLDGLSKSFPLPAKYASPERFLSDTGTVYSLTLTGTAEDALSHYKKLLTDSGWKVEKQTETETQWGKTKTVFISDKVHCGWVAVTARPNDILVTFMAIDREACSRMGQKRSGVTGQQQPK